MNADGRGWIFVLIHFLMVTDATSWLACPAASL